MIFMNPPYDKNLYIKILDQALKEHPDEIIINLSPISWLQDPLAKKNKNSDWNKFENVRKHIESLEVIDSKQAEKLFNIRVGTDLGIYTLSPQGGWINPWENKLVEKIADGIKDNLKNHIVVDNLNGISLLVSNFCDGSRGGCDSYLYLFKDRSYYKNTKNETTGETYLEYSEKVAWGNRQPKDKQTNIKFNSELERDNFYDSYQTKLLKWYFQKINIRTGINPKYLPWLGDYSKQWTDEDICKYFNLTEEEIKTIYNEV